MIWLCPLLSCASHVRGGLGCSCPLCRRDRGNLALVCKYWRSIVDSDPALWRLVSRLCGSEAQPPLKPGLQQVQVLCILLRVAGERTTELGALLPHLQQLRTLKIWSDHLPRSHFTAPPQFWAALHGLPSLRRLDISWVEGVQPQHVAGLAQLEQLRLQASTTPGFTGALAGLVGLKHLDLSVGLADTAYEHGLAALTALGSLTSITLSLRGSRTCRLPAPALFPHLRRFLYRYVHMEVSSSCGLVWTGGRRFLTTFVTPPWRSLCCSCGVLAPQTPTPTHPPHPPLPHISNLAST